MLFALYINDIVGVSRSCNTLLFADDTSLFATDADLSSLFDRVNSDLSLISRWLCANKLTLNISKTHFVLFHRKQRTVSLRPDCTLRIGDVGIGRVSETNFLGVMIDEHLCWGPHVR